MDVVKPHIRSKVIEVVVNWFKTYTWHHLDKEYLKRAQGGLDDANKQLLQLIRVAVKDLVHKLDNWNNWKIDSWMVERAMGAVYNVICEYHNPYYGEIQHMNSPTKIDTSEKMRKWADLVLLAKASKANAVTVRTVIESGK